MDGAETVTGDINDATAVSRALRGRQFDVVVNWIAFTAADIERDLELFRGRTSQYIFISSASAYQKPSTELSDYRIDAAGQSALGLFQKQDRVRRAFARRLIAKKAFPSRSSGLTYLWGKSDSAGHKQLGAILYRGRSDAERAKGDCPGGRNVTMGDYAQHRLCQRVYRVAGHGQAIGHAFHITTDEVLTWDQLYGTVAEAVGVELGSCIFRLTSWWRACLKWKAL